MKTTTDMVVTMIFDTGGTEPDWKTRAGETALMSAAAFGNTEKVKMLIEKGADVNAQYEDGWTPLMVAAMEGHTKTAEVLIEKGANVNAQSKYGRWTTLMLAADTRHTKIVSLLKQAGAKE